MDRQKTSREKRRYYILSPRPFLNELLRSAPKMSQDTEMDERDEVDLWKFQPPVRKLNENGLWLDKVIEWKASHGGQTHPYAFSPLTASYSQGNLHATQSTFPSPTMNPSMLDDMTSAFKSKMEVPFRPSLNSSVPDSNFFRLLNAQAAEARNARAKPLLSFHKFPQLPKEVRLMIWERALPGPRVVEIKLKKLKETAAHQEQEEICTGKDNHNKHSCTRMTWVDWDNFFDNPIQTTTRRIAENTADMSIAGIDSFSLLYGLKSMSPTPAMLLASKESHQVASKVYKRSLGTIHSSPDVYLDFQRDIVYIRFAEFFRDFLSQSSTFDIDHLIDILGPCIISNTLEDKSSDEQSPPSYTGHYPLIKNLAVQFDDATHNHTSSLNGDPEIHTAQLLDIFSGVENLSLCVAHHSATSPLPTNWKQKRLQLWDDYIDKSPVHFIEPISLSSVFSGYWSSTLAPSISESGLKHAIPVPEESKWLWHRRYWEDRRLWDEVASLRRCGIAEVQVPRVEWRVAISEEVKERPENFMRGEGEGERAVVKTVCPGNYLRGFGVGHGGEGEGQAVFERMGWGEYIELAVERFREAVEAKEAKERKEALERALLEDENDV